MCPDSIARRTLGIALGAALLAPTQSFVGSAINAKGEVAGTLTDAGALPVAAADDPTRPTRSDPRRPLCLQS